MNDNREMTDAPASHIPPCTGEFVGKKMTDWCRDCEHALAVHRQDQVCSICDAIAQLRAELGL